MLKWTCSQLAGGGGGAACQDIEEDGSGSDFLSEDVGNSSGIFLKGVLFIYWARVHHASSGSVSIVQ